MSLIINQKALETTKEHELFKDSFGYNALIIFKDDSVEIRTNLSEIHWRYNMHYDQNRHKVAFESDTHSTGGTVEISKIRSVVCWDAKISHDDYYHEL